jgi:hypothetical protein
VGISLYLGGVNSPREFGSTLSFAPDDLTVLNLLKGEFLLLKLIFDEDREVFCSLGGCSIFFFSFFIFFYFRLLPSLCKLGSLTLFLVRVKFLCCQFPITFFIFSDSISILFKYFWPCDLT